MFQNARAVRNTRDKFIWTITRRKLSYIYKGYIGESKGDARDAPRGLNSFIFMQLSEKYLHNNRILGVGAPPQENPGSATGIDLLNYVKIDLSM